jgi:hypothetical protein
MICIRRYTAYAGAQGFIKSVAPILTPELFKEISGLLDRAGSLLTKDFIRETKGLIGTVAPVITPDLLAQVGGLLDNADELLSKKFVNETQTLIEDAADVSRNRPGSLVKLADLCCSCSRWS